VAGIAQGCPREAAAGKLTRHRDDALAVMDIRRRDVDRQREAVIGFAALRVSTARWIIDRGASTIDPLIFLPPSKPRPKQVGADGQERLSMMTALGSAASPQACRQARTRRPGSRRHGQSRVHRANGVHSAPNGMPHSRPIARHGRPQDPTYQVAMVALRGAAPASGGFGPERVGRVPSAAMAASSASTASTKASRSENASHEAGEVVAVLTAVPMGGRLGDGW
jgi:hypothetical protein